MTSWDLCVTLTCVLSVIAVRTDEFQSANDENPGAVKMESDLTGDFRIGYSNIQSLRHKTQRLGNEFWDFDMICVAETWLQEDISDDDVKIEGFKIHRKDRVGGQHGGVCIYTGEHLLVKRRSDLEVEDMELIWVEVASQHKNLLCGAFYKPPRTSRSFWDVFEDLLREVKRQFEGTVILIGDSNVDQAKKGNVLEEICADSDFTQLVDQPTRYGENSATILDVVLTSGPDFIKNVEVLPPSLSD